MTPNGIKSCINCLFNLFCCKQAEFQLKRTNGDLNQAMFYKHQAPVPPRMGLMWDAVKHRWTRPEKVGRTVWEVQGKKRLRGAGTGAHERTRSTRGHGGKGSGSAEAGRRFRSVADTGRAHPHEATRVGQVAHKRRKPVGGK